MKKSRLLLGVLLCWLVFSTIALGNGLNLEVWSDVQPFFETSVFANRFSVVNDDLGTSFLSIDGSYFREVDLTYRLLRGSTVEEEVFIAPKGHLDNPYVLLDPKGTRHLVWLEHRSGANTLNYAQVEVPYRGHVAKVVWETANIIQDLSTFQAGDTTHLVWSERDRYYQIRYGQVRDGQLIIAETITGSADASTRPAVAVDEQGVVHIVWYELTPLGVEVRHTMKQDSEWTNSRVLGAGDVKDIEQGGMVDLQALGASLYATWSAPVDQSKQLAVQLVEIRRGRSIGAVPIVLGTRPRLIVHEELLHMVWQSSGEFGSQIRHGILQNGILSETITLTEGRNSGLRPEVIIKEGHIYVYWLQASRDRGYQVMEINNQFPRTMTFWSKIGIDKQNPLEHLSFLISTTLMLAPLFLLTNIVVLLIGGFAFFILQRFAVFRKRPLFYRVVLVATLLSLARHLPIPKANLAFLGATHYGLSVPLATLGTYLIMKPIKERDLFANVAMILFWMFFFQFFASLPHNILV